MAEAGQAGAAGQPSGPVASKVCPTLGEYDAGEGGCQSCTDDAPTNEVLSCVEAFFAKDVLADNGPIAVRLSPFSGQREPLDVPVQVYWQGPDAAEVLDTTMVYVPLSAQFEIDVTAIPSDAVQIRVQPFVVKSVCGDSLTLTEEVIFVSGGDDSWAATCPNQT